VLAIRTAVLAQEATSDKENLYPHAAELLVGALAFAIVFYFLWKWVIPRVNQLLEERRQQIQCEIERAEATRGEADHLLADYREQLAGARDEANRIIEEGSWGSRGGVLSFLDLLEHGASHFSPERTAAIRTALAVKYER